jgi:hypothetical protein
LSWDKEKVFYVMGHGQYGRSYKGARIYVKMRLKAVFEAQGAYGTVKPKSAL